MAKASAADNLKDPTFLDGIGISAVEEAHDIVTSDLFYAPSESIFSAVADNLVTKNWSVFPQKQDRRPAVVHHKAIRWQREHNLDSRLPTKDEVELWKRHCASENVACVMGPSSGNSFALDVDVTDEDLCRQVVDLADSMLGYTPLRRVGSIPKIALFYRFPDGDDIQNVSRHFVDFDDNGAPVSSGHMLEVAGKGKLITLFGKHHKTGRYYRWLDLNPIAIGPEAAPLVSSKRLEEFLERVNQDIKPFHRGASMAHDLSNWEWDENREIFLPGKLSGGEGFSSWVENSEGKVIDGRESYLFALVFQITRLNRGMPYEQIAKLAVEQFEATAEISGRWQGDNLPRQALEKARRLNERVQSGDIAFQASNRRSAGKSGHKSNNTSVWALPKSKFSVENKVLDECGLEFLKKKSHYDIPVSVTNETADVALDEDERLKKVDKVQEQLQDSLRCFFRDVVGHTRTRLEEEDIAPPDLEGEDAELMEGWNPYQADATNLHILKAPTGSGKTSQTIKFIAKHRKALFPSRINSEDGEEEPIEVYETENGTKKTGTRPIVFLLPTYENIEELKKRVLGLNLGGSDEEIRKAALELGIVAADKLEEHIGDLKREAMEAGLKVMVYRGKIAAGCQMKEKVELAQSAGINSSAFCKATQKLADGTSEEVLCEYYHSCPAIRQRNDIQESHVVFMPHAFMNLTIPSELSDVKSLIVDERIHHLFLHTTTFPLSTLSLGRKPPRLTKREREEGVSGEDLLQDRQDAAEVTMDAMKRGICPAEELYMTKDNLGKGQGSHGIKIVQSALRVCGGGLKRDVEITPDTPMDILQEICARPTGLHISEEYRFWKIVHERLNMLVNDDLIQNEVSKLKQELETFQGFQDIDVRFRKERQLEKMQSLKRQARGKRDMRIQFLRLHEENKLREAIRISWRTEPNWMGIPMLLLDASAAPEVVAKIWNGDTPKVHEIEGPLHVRVVGIVDQTYSNASLVGTANDSIDEKSRVARRLNKVRKALSTIGGYYGWGRVVCGASILVRKAINNNWKGPPNVDWCHYGAMRGLDFAKHHSAAFSVGRMEVPIHSVDGLVAALTYDDETPEEPYDLLGTGRLEGDKPLILPMGVQRLKMRDGRIVEVPAPMYPGKWGRLMQKQYREEELNQFVGRLRPVYREGEAPVWFALSSVIPEDYVIDHLIHIDALATRTERYWDAIRRSQGIVEPSIVYQQNPDTFASKEQAEKKLTAIGFDFNNGTSDNRSTWGFVCLRWRSAQSTEWSYAYALAACDDQETILTEALQDTLEMTDITVERVGQGRGRTRASAREPDKIDLEMGDDKERASKEAKIMDDAAVYVFEKGFERSGNGREVIYPISFQMPKSGSMSYSDFEAMLSIGKLWDRIQYEKTVSNPLSAVPNANADYDDLANHVDDSDSVGDVIVNNTVVEA